MVHHYCGSCDTVWYRPIEQCFCPECGVRMTSDETEPVVERLASELWQIELEEYENSDRGGPYMPPMYEGEPLEYQDEDLGDYMRARARRLLSLIGKPPCECCDQPARYCGETHPYRPPRREPSNAAVDEVAHMLPEYSTDDLRRVLRAAYAVDFGGPWDARDNQAVQR